jgi:hypothetical protein
VVAIALSCWDGFLQYRRITDSYCHILRTAARHTKIPGNVDNSQRLLEGTCAGSLQRTSAVVRGRFTDAFRAFVHRYISSVEQIEVLLILRGAPDRSFTAEDISAIVRTNTASLAGRLAGLARAGLAAKDQGRYRYAAKGALARMVDTLADEYATRRFSVIELVFSRAEGAHSFADAFLLRDEHDTDG